ncbi:MAG TPA: protein translocase subunit SecF [Desulfotomaculum sp.]|nr:MAG: preprotein translocase subunit SecF [Desulfotomaculum sp. BICA1-6]HBX23811.1 protein translocase subunit SecF [Desulfotomaculum sp.]
MFSFIKHRKIWYIISLLVILPGLVSLALQGLNLGIDFTGGNLVEIRAEQGTDIQDVRGVIEGLGFGASNNVQISGDSDYLIRTRELSEEESATLVSSLDEKLGGVTLLRNERVGPVIGQELAVKALLALVVASILMLIYITYRFELRQGIAAIIAILHDILVVLGVFSIFQLEVDSAFVAAILTIIGYSINDTIIIFDRIRENLKTRKKGETLDELVNTSLWQTLARSINTVLTVMFVLLALYFLGGTTVKNFVLAMLIGVASGAYSSIFNASPVWVDLKLREKKNRA